MTGIDRENEELKHGPIHALQEGQTRCFGERLNECEHPSNTLRFNESFLLTCNWNCVRSDNLRGEQCISFSLLSERRLQEAQRTVSQFLGCNTHKSLLHHA